MDILPLYDCLLKTRSLVSFIYLLTPSGVLSLPEARQ